MTPGSPDQPRPAHPTREERLAAKLRENLRRRKAQARAMGEAPGPEASDAEPTATESSAALSKPDPSR